MQTSIHLGVSRVASEYVDLATVGEFRSIFSNNVRLIKKSEYRNHFRSLINERNGVEFALLQSNLKESAFWLELSKKEQVTINQHAALGTPQDLLRGDKWYPQAALRLGRVAGLFGEADLVIHLSITAQADLIELHFEEEQLESVKTELKSCDFSWLSFVRRLREVCPKATIVVWDFEVPSQVALPFLAIMTNTDPDEILKVASAQLHEIANRSIEPKSTLSADLCGALDDLYVQDLTYLAQEEGVRLFSGNSIPVNLHI